MSEVPYVKLKELCSVNQGLQIPISKRFRDKGENRHFYITVQFLKEGHLEKFYVENPPKSSICSFDDIIVVRTGSTGQILTGIEGCFHNNFFKVNYDKEKVVGKFLYYCLKTKEKQKEMKNRSGITTIPDLNHFMFLDMKIPIPDYHYQQLSVQILDSLSKKIEVNNKINAELEGMAKLIYDYWFVQFDFPFDFAQGKPADHTSKPQDVKPYKSSGGKMVYNKELKREIPEGWDVQSFIEQANITTGKLDSNAEVAYGKYPFFTCASKPTKVDSFKFDDDVLLVAGNNAQGNFHLNRYSGKFNAYQRTYVITAKEDQSLDFLYQVLKFYLPLFKTKGNGSQTKFLTIGMLNEIPVFKMPTEVLIKFIKVVKPLYQKQVIINKENQKLSELRDWLLPMLMNGQVRVKEAKQYVADTDVRMAAEEEQAYGK